MRLFEVTDQFANELELVLRNLLGRSDEKHTSMKLSYEALSNLMKNMGYGKIDYQGFDNVFQGNPSLKSVVKNYNEDGIELSTEKPPEDNGEPTDVPAGPSVDQMAHSAVNTPEPF
jgi:hypothetical protein